MAIELKDWDTPGGDWDAGFQWDVNLGPSIGDITPFTDLIPPENNDKPKFMATMAALLQPLADNIACMASMPGKFDLDVAVGQQEDITGLWIGVSRYLSEALTGVYFAFDTPGVGFDQGVWQGRFDPTTGLVALPDEQYRTLLKATVAANQWNGTIPGAEAAWEILFPQYNILIFDYQDMTMAIGISGQVPDAVTLGMLRAGLLNLKPAGVRVIGYFIPTAPGPLFGFDVDNSAISGFDIGSWADFLPPT